MIYEKLMDYFLWCILDIPNVNRIGMLLCEGMRGHIPTTHMSRGEISRYKHLVDPASSDMLVSKVKPCMCKFKSFNGETANGSL